jgi:hypothetical protein
MARSLPPQMSHQQVITRSFRPNCVEEINESQEEVDFHEYNGAELIVGFGEEIPTRDFP